MLNTPAIQADAYKISHAMLYPEGTEKIYSVLIPRKSSFDHKNVPNMVSFGYQYFVASELADNWNQNFFEQPWKDLETLLTSTFTHILGKSVTERVIGNFKDLYALGYLPIEVRALPEGSLVPNNVPVLTMTNTLKGYGWLPSLLETITLADTFVSATSATNALEFRTVAEKYAMKTADTRDYLDFSFHDFSERGQHGNDAAVLSGIGHLSSFRGTDILQAPVALNRYYTKHGFNPDGAPLDELEHDSGTLGASVVASEHSVMESYGLDEYETYRQLIKNNPTGVLSLVSDTYDYWHVVEDVLPSLHDEIMARDGKLVIRPDSFEKPAIELVESLQSLWGTFGGTINSKGYKVLDSHVGLLHGEGVTPKTVGDFMETIADAGFSTENIVFGVGAYVYSSLVSRDSFSQAMKAQLVVINGKEKQIYKAPHDSHYPKSYESKLKTSLVGGVSVHRDKNGKLFAIDGLSLDDISKDSDNEMHIIFKDGKLLNQENIHNIRQKLHQIAINGSLYE